MAVNQYFNWQYQNNEQSIIADIIDESIQNHGVDVKYLHRTKDSDPLFAEDPIIFFQYRNDHRDVCGRCSELQRR